MAKNKAVKLFHASTLPPGYYYMITNMINDGGLQRVCRGKIPAEYGQGSLQAVIDSDGYIAVALQRASPASKFRIVAFAFLLTNDYITQNKRIPGPVCMPDEWYIDIACAAAPSKRMQAYRKKRKEAGTKVAAAAITLLLKHVEKVAVERHGIRAIRLYALDGPAFNFWSRQGYLETETPCQPNPRVKREHYFHAPDDGVRMTKCLRPTATASSYFH